MTGRRVTGLLGSLAVLAITVGLPLVLWATGGAIWSRLPTHLADAAAALRSPDDGTVALAAVQVVGWAAWLLLSGSILLEVVTRIRRVRTPQVPGLRVPQGAARNLVAVAALLFTVGSTTLAVPTPATAQFAHAAPAHPGPRTPSTASVSRAVPPAPRTTAASTRAHTVRRGETLWSIARDHLGSGDRYLEIARLNADVLHGRPGFILPGTVLQLPSPTGPRHGEPTDRVTVHRGDTLSGIAEDRLGDSARYPEIFYASTSITQPGGAHLTDPDVIDIGWTLAIPTHHNRATKVPERRRTRARQPHHPQTGGRHSIPDETVGATSPPSSPPATEPTATATRAPDAATPSVEPADHRGEVDAVGPSWLLTGLTGGIVLAAALLVTLRRRRWTQHRHRRPGHTIATPDAALAPVEKTIAAVGGPAAPTIEALDGLLRHLARYQTEHSQPMPRLAAVELADRTVKLHLSEPADLEPPWQGSADRLRWTHTLPDPTTDIPGDVGDQPAPYPLLVTVGSSDTGQPWLLNLEDLGVITITGDPTYAHDMARYIAAELACNPWAEGVRVDCIGLAIETAPLNPERVLAHPTVPAAGVDPIADAIADAVATHDRTTEPATDVTTARAHQAGAEPWPARVLMVDLADHTPAALDQLIHLVDAQTGRTATAIITTGGSAARGAALHVTGAGRVAIDHAGLDLVAVGLTPDEAEGCAALLAQADTLDDTDIPERDDTAGWRAFADEAGALRATHTLPRHTRLQDLAEPAASLLDADDRTYLEVAATTVEDLATLAPQVPASVAAAVEGADPTLDAEVAAWFADDCDLPRLTLLGPVGVRAHGAAIAKRKPYYTELLTYLATRRHGATPDEVADAFAITGARVRNDVKVVRDWLGVNPRTGRKHLPDARDAPSAQTRGVAVYEIDGLLTDADLFRRLRVRGQSRGPEGIRDFQQALRLVTGQPFDRLRRGGWTWLYEGDRLDQHLLCGIVDVAHIVTTANLQTGDIPVARAAAELAVQAAPYEEIPQLDLAAVASAEGNHTRATQIVRDHICNRSDDPQPPLELPHRTETVIDGHDWLAERREAS